jgi:hypothetical protein
MASDRHLRRLGLDLLGAVAAFGQTNIKRLLAYSSINNVGFALVGLAAGTPQGASSVLFYMAVYVVMTLGAFLCVLWMRDKDGNPVEDITALSGLSQTRPAYAAAIAIFMFSLAGIPPLFGFWPKLLVFQAAVNSGLVALAVAAIVGTVVGAYYYLRIVKVMYFDDGGEQLGRVRQPVAGYIDLPFRFFAVSPLGYLLSRDRFSRSRTERRGPSSGPASASSSGPARPTQTCSPIPPPPKATGWLRWSRTRAGAVKAANGSARRAISSGSTIVAAWGREILRRPRFRSLRV